jgi:RHS repeat-associated protein
VSSSGGVLKAAYGYDGLNRRISEQVAASAAGDAATAAIRDLFYSADWQVLEERLRSGGAVGATAEARYVWSPVYVDAMVLRERGSERVYALQDGNWNTTALIAAAGVPGKATGDLIQRMVYNPYGEVFLLNPDWTEQLGTPLVPWQHLFQGLKFSEATGLGYVRNRDYSPSLGRFIELDPLGFDAGDNNWYRFVGNGPVGRVDPSGLWTLGFGLGVSGNYAVVGGSVSIVPTVAFWWIVPIGFDVMLTACGGGDLGGGVSPGAVGNITSASTVWETSGTGEEVGVNTPFGGVDWISGRDECKAAEGYKYPYTYEGVQISLPSPVVQISIHRHYCVSTGIIQWLGWATGWWH